MRKGYDGLAAPVQQIQAERRMNHRGDCSCPSCGGKLACHWGGCQIREILDYEPARFKVIRRVRPR